MKIRFQADWDLNHDILTGVRRREQLVDFRTAADARLSGVPDPEVLASAADDGRIIVSHDVSTMRGHFLRFIETRRSPGVLLIPQSVTVRDAIEGVLLVWACDEAEDWTDLIDYVPA